MDRYLSFTPMRAASFQLPCWIHLAWALSMLHFWWWEYRLGALAWRFELYLFVMGFAILYHLMCAVLSRPTSRNLVYQLSWILRSFDVLG